MPRSDSFLTRVTTILHQTSSYQTETDRKA